MALMAIFETHPTSNAHPHEGQTIKETRNSEVMRRLYNKTSQ
jgi:hypothetical protein